jgi:hypothetical protein
MAGVAAASEVAANRRAQFFTVQRTATAARNADAPRTTGWRSKRTPSAAADIATAHDHASAPWRFAGAELSVEATIVAQDVFTAMRSKLTLASV